jgi:alkyl sulfatase BDS1-like metallo-beta-lactamase superfamily hydrolase
MTQGKYLEATEILNKLVFAEPKQPGRAKDLLADTFEQLGYQKESPSVRNSFLQGAYELRNGLPGGVPPRTTGPGRDPRDVDRAVARLPRHQHGPEEGRGHASSRSTW